MKLGVKATSLGVTPCFHVNDAEAANAEPAPADELDQPLRLRSDGLGRVDPEVVDPDGRRRRRVRPATPQGSATLTLRTGAP